MANDLDHEHVDIDFFSAVNMHLRLHLRHLSPSLNCSASLIGQTGLSVLRFKMPVNTPLPMNSNKIRMFRSPFSPHALGNSQIQPFTVRFPLLQLSQPEVKH